MKRTMKRTVKRRARPAVKLPDALPEDVLLGLPRISLRGNTRLYLENHDGILVYDADLLRVRTQLGVAVVTGKNFLLDALGEKDLLLRGTIESFRYEE